MNASLSAFRMAGAIGQYEYRISGCYEPMEEMIGGVRVFRQLGGNWWMVYCQGAWIVQDTSDKGTIKRTITCFAYVDTPLRPPQLCSTWEVDATEVGFETQQLSFTAMSQVSP